jgi:hypothetical protein
MSEVIVVGGGPIGFVSALGRTGFSKQDYTYLVHKTGERIDFSFEVLNGRTPGCISAPRRAIGSVVCFVRVTLRMSRIPSADSG